MGSGNFEFRNKVNTNASSKAKVINAGEKNGANSVATQWKRYDSRDLKSRRKKELLENEKRKDPSEMELLKTNLEKDLCKWDQAHSTAQSDANATIQTMATDPYQLSYRTGIADRTGLKEKWMSGEGDYRGAVGANAYTSNLYTLINQYKRRGLDLDEWRRWLEECSPGLTADRKTDTLSPEEATAFKRCFDIPWKPDQLGQTVNEALIELERRVKQIADQLEHDMTHGDYTKTDEDMVVYRGLSTAPGQEINYNNDSFLSTSFSLEKATEFSTMYKRNANDESHIFKGKVPKGFHAQYVAPISQFKNEEELLLAPGAKFREYDQEKVKGLDGNEHIEHFGEYGRDYLALTRKENKEKFDNESAISLGGENLDITRKENKVKRLISMFENGMVGIDNQSETPTNISRDADMESYFADHYNIPKNKVKDLIAMYENMGETSGQITDLQDMEQPLEEPISRGEVQPAGMPISRRGEVQSAGMPILRDAGKPAKVPTVPIGKFPHALDSDFRDEERDTVPPQAIGLPLQSDDRDDDRF